ncbi:alpha/beta hydrolase fold domain-containing protein [Penicillium sp. IBT 35674x]|nr:alpha/beta hydrolase fold domain-containing protein [Penicillium sp. IBT 35674x]
MNRLSEYSDTLTLPSGRILAWKLYGGTLQGKGTEKSDIVFYFHGYPGCFVEATLISVELLKKSNIRCIAPDRPGMNMTTHYDERRILDWPTDVLAIADHLSVSRFFVLGVSGGGPYALACAYSVSRDRLQGVAVVSVLKICLWVAREETRTPKVLEAAVDKAMEGRTEAERMAWKNERVGLAAIESVRGAFRQGGRPSATELMILCDWGFQLDKIAGESVQIWHGKLDRNVPIRMAEQAAELMPEAKIHFFEDEGHLGLSANHISKILADLISQ